MRVPQYTAFGFLDAFLRSTHLAPNHRHWGGNYTVSKCTEGETEAQGVGAWLKVTEPGRRRAATGTQGCGFPGRSFFRDWIKGGPRARPGWWTEHADGGRRGAGSAWQGGARGSGGRKRVQGSPDPREGSSPGAGEGDPGREGDREGPAGFGRTSSSRRRQGRGLLTAPAPSHAPGCPGHPPRPSPHTPRPAHLPLPYVLPSRCNKVASTSCTRRGAGPGGAGAGGGRARKLAHRRRPGEAGAEGAGRAGPGAPLGHRRGNRLGAAAAWGASRGADRGGAYELRHGGGARAAGGGNSPARPRPYHKPRPTLKATPLEATPRCGPARGRSEPARPAPPLLFPLSFIHLSPSDSSRLGAARTSCLGGPRALLGQPRRMWEPKEAASVSPREAPMDPNQLQPGTRTRAGGGPVPRQDTGGRLGEGREAGRVLSLSLRPALRPGWARGR